MSLLNSLLKTNQEPAEVEKFTENASPASPHSWLCPHCGRPASIDDVDWAADGERRLTFWSCDPCGVVAVTPDAIKEPPTNWVKRTEQ